MAINIEKVAQDRGITTEQANLLRELRGLTAEGFEAIPENAPCANAPIKRPAIMA